MKNSKNDLLKSILSINLPIRFIQDLQNVVFDYLYVNAKEQAETLLKDPAVIKWLESQSEKAFVHTLHEILQAISESKAYRPPAPPNQSDYHQNDVSQAAYEADLASHEAKHLLMNEQRYHNPIEALQELTAIADKKAEQPYYFSLHKPHLRTEEECVQEQIFQVIVSIVDVDINGVHLTPELSKLLYLHMLDLNLKCLAYGQKERDEFKTLNAKQQLASRVADWKRMGVACQFITFKGRDGYQGLFSGSEVKYLSDVESYQKTRQKHKSRRLTAEEQKILQDTIGLFLVRNPVPIFDLWGVVKKQRGCCQILLVCIKDYNIDTLITSIRELQEPHESTPFQACLKALLKDLESFLPEQAMPSLPSLLV